METTKDSTLSPITLCRSIDTVLCGGYSLKELKNIFNFTEVKKNIVPSVEDIKSGDYKFFNYPWDIIIQNKRILKENLFFRIQNDNLTKIQDGVYVYPDVDISPYVHFIADTNNPIVINSNSKIDAFCYIEGPVYIGKNSEIKPHSQIKHNSCIGDVCKVGGELESTVFSSYSNKQHYGFIGNSFIGEWVNIGAGTSNSDLKNTYGNIKIEYQNKIIETNEQFLGCVIGDYSKTAINTTIYTGKIIGVNNHIYGNVLKNIPSFINFKSGVGLQNDEFKLDIAIKIQKRMFERRNKLQTDNSIDILKKAFKQSKSEREIFLKIN